ncbi:MAG: DnaJ domain-containing protein [Lachnospiraceae bacterium]|nr:DnaJ domain-containing protein [Lachnospiraceae bacterium]
MDEYYKILGLEPGADAREIKKAYFRLIRQHTPEQDPDGFKEIREAYDQLKNRDESEETLTFPRPQDPWACRMLEYVQECRESSGIEYYRDACEEAWRKFPEEIQFLYLLMLAQRQAGNTGKAVKNAELLVSMEPENKWFQRELAISYMERGFTKKAGRAFQTAYEKGCRDNDFLLMYSMNCDECEQYEEGISVLLELVRKKRKYGREELPDILAAYIGLYTMSRELEGNRFSEILDEVLPFVRQYSVYMEENIADVVCLVGEYAAFSCNTKEDCRKIDEIYFTLTRACHSKEARETLSSARKQYNVERVCCDERLGEVLEMAAMSEFAPPDLLEMAFMEKADMERILRYAKLDAQLCMLVEREELKGEFAIVQEEYPEFFEYIRDFLGKLKNEKNISYLKDSLLKTFVRLDEEYGNSMFYRRHPEERRRAHGTLISDGDSGEPYVRGAKKIGRNDPCPCGSGKKYKQCCGK